MRTTSALDAAVANLHDVLARPVPTDPVARLAHRDQLVAAVAALDHAQIAELEERIDDGA